MQRVRLNVLHAKTCRPYSEAYIDPSEVAMLQPIAATRSVEVGVGTDKAETVEGNPAHTIITLKSGLQFMVAELLLEVVTIFDDQIKNPAIPE